MSLLLHHYITLQYQVFTIVSLNRDVTHTEVISLKKENEPVRVVLEMPTGDESFKFFYIN